MGMPFVFFRYTCFKKLLNAIESSEAEGLDGFTQGYKEFGIHARPDGSIYCKEWCPGAKQLYLWGEFSEFLNSINSSLFIHLACFFC
jgi:1,4-alpha-glucan branching enzyme